MANNVLYIVDTEKREAFKLAKGFSDGHWNLYPNMTHFLHHWFDDRDWAATNGEPKTCLVLMTENDPDLVKYLKKG
jgi:hypothetical protein